MVLVTGATGTVGGLVVRELEHAGIEFCALARDAEKAAPLRGRGIEVRQGDYERPDSLRDAFAGAERLFLVAPLTPALAELEGHASQAAADGRTSRRQALDRWRDTGRARLRDGPAPVSTPSRF